jgi:hypothetical protein
MSPVPETAVAIALRESLIERHLAVEQRLAGQVSRQRPGLLADVDRLARWR